MLLGPERFRSHALVSICGRDKIEQGAGAYGVDRSGLALIICAILQRLLVSGLEAEKAVIGFM